MRTSATILFLFGLTLILGGFMGWARAASYISLVMGCGLGITLVACGWIMLKGKAWALYTAMLITTGIAALFAYRFFKTQQMMPAGMILVMSLLTLSALLVGLQNKR
ncbi:MAG: TMEM14 family protein [Chlamydiales bacterium]|nr:TMEM14 family protein [Chlamydiales bacterium]